MEAKHTPGPWGNRHFNRAGQIEIHTNTHVMCKVLCREIDRCGSVDSDSVHEAAANARLIAAAPELLGVLLGLVEYWNNGTPVHAGAEIVSEVRAAIAKATGTES